jgi:hypothetical protein
LDSKNYIVNELFCFISCLFEGNEMSANDTQVGGNHYAKQEIQTWDYIAANEIGYFEGNVIKYVSRWKQKGGIEDLRKAQHYLSKLIELNIKE